MNKISTFMVIYCHSYAKRQLREQIAEAVVFDERV